MNNDEEVIISDGDVVFTEADRQEVLRFFEMDSLYEKRLRILLPEAKAFLNKIDNNSDCLVDDDLEKLRKEVNKTEAGFADPYGRYRLTCKIRYQILEEAFDICKEKFENISG